MAHNLEIINGTASFAAAGQKAWHGLGTYVENAMTAEECIKLARLDWEVEKRPVYVEGETPNTFSSVPKYFATTRTDNNAVLGVVGANYHPLQNRECFAFFDAIVERGEAIYETAGVLGQGERVFLTAKLPQDFRVAGEEIDGYVLLTNAHDGSKSLEVGITPVRVVCQNTLNAALSGLRNRINLRHTVNVQGQLKEASRVMQIASTYTQNVMEVFNHMATVRINDKQLRRFIEMAMKPGVEVMTAEQREAFSKQFVAKVDATYEFALSHQTQQTEATKGTLWGAYNAVSGYFGHLKEHKSQTGRMKDLIWGGAAETVTRAFEIAVEASGGLAFIN
jgi:phage/plasmid-like protein (TIGR03299 family)